MRTDGLARAVRQVAAQLAEAWDRAPAAFLAGTVVESPCSARVVKQTLRDGARVARLPGERGEPVRISRDLGRVRVCRKHLPSILLYGLADQRS